jgi:hypothetical protein
MFRLAWKRATTIVKQQFAWNSYGSFKTVVTTISMSTMVVTTPNNSISSNVPIRNIRTPHEVAKKRQVDQQRFLSDQAEASRQRTQSECVDITHTLRDMLLAQLLHGQLQAFADQGERGVFRGIVPLYDIFPNGMSSGALQWLEKQ